MNTNELPIDRRTYLATTGALTAGVVGLAGCLGDSTATGNLQTRVTDQPGDIADFESCVVSITGVWLGRDSSSDGSDADDGDTNETDGNETDADGTDADDSDSDDADEREYHEFDEAQEADLVDLQGDSTQLVDERELETASYAYLQLDVDGVTATLADGSDASVEVPGEAPLTFNEPFEIREDTTTSFTADFTPVARGGAGGYILQPVPTGITVEYAEGT